MWDREDLSAAGYLAGWKVVRRLPGGGYAGGSDPRKDGHAVAR